MWDVIEIVVSFAVTTIGSFALLRWDERRLPPDQLERAWPPVSKAVAVVWFSFFALPVHYWRTRRGVKGVVVGLVSEALLAWALLGGIEEAIAWVAWP